MQSPPPLGRKCRTKLPTGSHWLRQPSGRREINTTLHFAWWTFSNTSFKLDRDITGRFSFGMFFSHKNYPSLRSKFRFRFQRAWSISWWWYCTFTITKKKSKNFTRSNWETVLTKCESAVRLIVQKVISAGTGLTDSLAWMATRFLPPRKVDAHAGHASTAWESSRQLPIYLDDDLEVCSPKPLGVQPLGSGWCLGLSEWYMRVERKIGDIYWIRTWLRAGLNTLWEYYYTLPLLMYHAWRSFLAILIPKHGE